MSEENLYAGITFKAFFSKATTTVDGGWRISFDLGEWEADKVSKIANTKGRSLQVAIIPDPSEDEYG